jgi:hypothetical protein
MQNSPTRATIGLTSRLLNQSFLPPKQSRVLRWLLSLFCPPLSWAPPTPTLPRSKQTRRDGSRHSRACAPGSLAGGRFTHLMREATRACCWSRRRFAHQCRVEISQLASYSPTTAWHCGLNPAGKYTASRLPLHQQERCDIGEIQSVSCRPPQARTVASRYRDGRRRVPHFSVQDNLLALEHMSNAMHFARHGIW